jgi:hypothetical protein
MDQAMNANDWYLYQGVANVIVFHRVVAQRLLGSTPDEVAIAVAMPKAHAVFSELSRASRKAILFRGRRGVSRRSHDRAVARHLRARAGISAADRRRSQSRRVAPAE